MIPHVTQFDEADITRLEKFRVALNKEQEKNGIKVTVLAFLIKAGVDALKKFPMFNSSLDGENLIVKHYYHIGFAADTPNGLVVPVIRDADRKSRPTSRARPRNWPRRRATASFRRARCRAAASRFPALAASAARRLRRSSTHRRSPSSACLRAELKPKWDGKRLCAAADAAAVAVLRPPRGRRRRRRAFHHRPGPTPRRARPCRLRQRKPAEIGRATAKTGGGLRRSRKRTATRNNKKKKKALDSDVANPRSQNPRHRRLPRHPGDRGHGQAR